jgi:hypothetical protein
MLENLSFYKYPTFCAVITRFSILKKILRKTNFFSARKSVSVFNTAAYGKIGFFLNSIYSIYHSSNDSLSVQ